jgi:hypothetical protein
MELGIEVLRGRGRCGGREGDVGGGEVCVPREMAVAVTETELIGEEGGLGDEMTGGRGFNGGMVV